MKKKHKTSNTSVISYYAILEELSERQKEVLICLKKLGGTANNKMIHEEMKKKYPRMDISSISGRMYELRNDKKRKGILMFDHSGRCPITNETTKFYRTKKWIQEVQGTL